MAQVKTTKKGFELSDSVTLKGKNLRCEFNYEITADSDVDPKAGYFDKFVAYFAQEAADKWNKAAVEVSKGMQGVFDAADKHMGKFVADVEKHHIKDPEATIQEQADKYKEAFTKQLEEKILKKVGTDFIENAHKVAVKKMGKEGKALKQNKAKIAFKIGLVVVKVLAVAAAAVVTVATAGAGTPLLVAAAAWLALSAKSIKSLFDAAKEANSIRESLRKDATKMEKMLAEIDAKYVAAVKFARGMEAKADSMEVAADKLKASISESTKLLADVNPESKKFASQAASIEKDIEQLKKALDDVSSHRQYAPALKSAFDDFRKVKNDQSWGTKLEKGGKGVTMANDVASGLQGLAKGINAVT